MWSCFPNYYETHKNYCRFAGFVGLLHHVLYLHYWQVTMLAEKKTMIPKKMRRSSSHFMGRYLINLHKEETLERSKTHGLASRQPEW